MSLRQWRRDDLATINSPVERRKRILPELLLLPDSSTARSISEDVAVVVNLNDNSLLRTHANQLPLQPSRNLTDPPFLPSIFRPQLPQHLLPVILS